jgi:hypothetical protein
MRITSGGSVIINATTNANDSLQSTGAAAAWAGIFYGSSTSGSSYGLCSQAGTTSGDRAFQVRSQNGAVSYLVVRGDGILLSPTTVAYTTSASSNLNMGAAGDFRYSTASSQRFKDNIADWSGNGLETILALKPRTFNYKESYYSHPEIQMLGLIAEEVAEVSPFLADYENEDRTGQVENVKYANIVVPLIKAVQELSAQNQDLKSRLDKAGL